MDTSAEKLIKQNIETLKTVPCVDSDESLRGSDTLNLREHNKQYTMLLQAYVDYFKKTSDEKQKSKKILFIISTCLFLGMPILTVLLIGVILLCLIIHKIDIMDAVLELVATLVTLFSTFLVVPQMITGYLFNRKEDAHLANIVEKIQEYDNNIRGKL